MALAINYSGFLQDFSNSQSRMSVRTSGLVLRVQGLGFLALSFGFSVPCFGIRLTSLDGFWIQDLAVISGFVRSGLTDFSQNHHFSLGRSMASGCLLFPSAFPERQTIPFLSVGCRGLFQIGIP